jgi:hypothetical protein
LKRRTGAGYFHLPVVKLSQGSRKRVLLGTYYHYSWSSHY